MNALSPVIGMHEIRGYDGPDLYLFIGIDTGGSGVHRGFPLWAPAFHAESVVRGVDLPEDTPAEVFRELVRAMRDNPRIFGAVITSHKLRLYRAISDLVDRTDPLVEITHEINSLDSRHNRIAAYARDAQSLDLVIDTTGTDHAQPERPVVCIGAGGSAIALLLAMRLDMQATIAAQQPVLRSSASARGPLTIIGRRGAALEEIAAVRDRSGIAPQSLELVLTSGATPTGEVTRSALPGSLIANATGLGKFTAESPLPGPDFFPARSVAWDFNYRGPLTFLEQGRKAGLVVEDGWDYFVAGWSAALAAISEVGLDGTFFDQLRDASSPLRPRAQD